ASGTDTPVVVIALSIASVTYGALLGAYVLAGRWARASGVHVIGAAAITILVMLSVVFALPLSVQPGVGGLEPAARLAWPWYVPLGTLLCVVVGTLASQFSRSEGTA